MSDERSREVFMFGKNIHKYTPFTTRDGSTSCSKCYGPPSTLAHMSGEVTDEFVEAVEEECGMGAAAWDTISPKEIIAAVLVVMKRLAAETEVVK